MKSPLTFLNMGLRNPLGLPKIQNLIVGVKTPYIEVFYIPLERSRSVDVKMVLHEPFGHLQLDCRGQNTLH